MGPSRLWNTATCRQEKLIYSSPGQANYAVFSQDGRYLLIQDAVQGPSLWDLTNQRLIPVPWKRIENVLFAAAGELVVGASRRASCLVGP